MDDAAKITQHYERPSLVEHLRNALAASGLGQRRLSSKDLAPLDQFHSRRLGGHDGAGAGASPQRGNPRYRYRIRSRRSVPAIWRKHTQGINGRRHRPQSIICRRSKPSRRALWTRRAKSAISMGMRSPCRSRRAIFDVAWTQHFAMNIADRATFTAKHSACCAVAAASPSSTLLPPPIALCTSLFLGHMGRRQVFS